jgi:hypothetical protein
MHIDVLIICITILIAMGGIFAIAYFIVRPYLERMAHNNEIHVLNEKYALFNSINADDVKTRLDKYFEEFVNKYIVYKFMSKKITYIKDAEVEQMVTDLTKLIALDISELYIFYIKLNTSVSTQDDLLVYIKSKVQADVVDAVSSYNKASIINAEKK